MHRIRTITLATVLAIGLSSAPAYADHYRGDDGNCNREGNCNDQRRCSGDNCTDNHKAFSPDLKDSPTTLVFCLPGSTCNFNDNGQKKQPPSGT